MAKRLRVFEAPDGTRWVRQLTEEEFDAYVAENPNIKVVR